MKILLILLIILYVLKLYLNNQKLKNKLSTIQRENEHEILNINSEIKNRNSTIETKQNQINETENKIEVEKVRIQTLNNSFKIKIKDLVPPENFEKFEQMEVWVGMPSVLVTYINGKPEEKQVTETPTLVNETWCYNPIPNARSNGRRFYYIIYIENKLVTTWDKQNIYA